MSDGIEVTGELQLLQPKEKLIPTADRTQKVEPKGVIQPDDMHIFLTEAILREVVDWSSTDKNHELGGVFVGDLHVYRGIPWVQIAGYIRAREYVNTSASFKFTHDSWSAITREKESRFEDRLIVGWHHTHPGYGIFLSGMDMFIQKHFFNHAWQVAMVVDPRAGKLGFFQWKKSQVIPCGFFFVR